MSQPVHQHDGCCSHKVTVASTVQTLDELDFERGVWSASYNNDTTKVSKYLQNGGDPNALDSAGYTALVGSNYICDSH